MLIGGTHHSSHVPDGRAHAAGGVLPTAAAQEAALAGQHAAGDDTQGAEVAHAAPMLSLTFDGQVEVFLALACLSSACSPQTSHMSNLCSASMADTRSDTSMLWCRAGAAGSSVAGRQRPGHVRLCAAADYQTSAEVLTLWQGDAHTRPAKGHGQRIRCCDVGGDTITREINFIPLARSHLLHLETTVMVSAATTSSCFDAQLLVRVRMRCECQSSHGCPYSPAPAPVQMFCTDLLLALLLLVMLTSGARHQ